ncbi:TPA: hypothetical protein ACGJ7A_006015 [Pseudomonas aeruginosa]
MSLLNILNTVAAANGLAHNFLECDESYKKVVDKLPSKLHQLIQRCENHRITITPYQVLLTELSKLDREVDDFNITYLNDTDVSFSYTSFRYQYVDEDRITHIFIASEKIEQVRSFVLLAKLTGYNVTVNTCI